MWKAQCTKTLKNNHEKVGSILIVFCKIHTRKKKKKEISRIKAKLNLDNTETTETTIWHYDIITWSSAQVVTGNKW